MKTLIHSIWTLKTKLEEINNKVMKFLDVQSIVYDSTYSGTYKIEGNKIHIDFHDYQFEGYWGDECLFGYIFKNDSADEVKCEFECKSYMSDSGIVIDYKVPDKDDEIPFLIHEIYHLIRDYRIDFNDGSRITKSRIQSWIEQFSVEDRVVILNEILNIFSKRYLSRDNVLIFWNTILSKLSEEYNFSSVKCFLQNCCFIRIQQKGKSQDVLLDILDSYIKNTFDISIDECGSLSKKYSIYVDDVLCTGLTLKNDITKWSEKSFSLNKTNYDAISDGSTNLICCYIFIHKKNYYKKVAEMRYKRLGKIADSMSAWATWIDNSIEKDSKLQIMIPIQDLSNSKVVTYENEVKKKVETYNKEKEYGDTKEEFYRDSSIPNVEEFFTSDIIRNKIEVIFLEKGLDILEKANVNNDRIRALGYSIPSHKNFGFGALCFTWRSVPNNAPLVFWYDGGGFLPLFDVRKVRPFVLPYITFNNIV